MDLCLLCLLGFGREDLGAGHDLERRGGHRGGEHDGRAEEERGGAGDVVGGEEGDGHDDLCRLRVERERRWAVGCVLVEERGSGRERGTVSDGGAMELGVWVDGGVCGCGCAWRYVKEEKREVRGERWRQVVVGTGDHMVSGANIFSISATETRDNSVKHIHPHTYAHTHMHTYKHIGERDAEDPRDDGRTRHGAE